MLRFVQDSAAISRLFCSVCYAGFIATGEIFQHILNAAGVTCAWNVEEVLDPDVDIGLPRAIEGFSRRRARGGCSVEFTVLIRSTLVPTSPRQCLSVSSILLLPSVLIAMLEKCMSCFDLLLVPPSAGAWKTVNIWQRKNEQVLRNRHLGQTWESVFCDECQVEFRKHIR